MIKYIFCKQNGLKNKGPINNFNVTIIPEKLASAGANVGNLLTVSRQCVSHATCQRAAYLQSVACICFKHVHFTGMIMALILVVDPMFSSSFSSQKCLLSFGYLRIFYVITQSSLFANNYWILGTQIANNNVIISCSISGLYFAVPPAGCCDSC
jgi:hypothetical protein